MTNRFEKMIGDICNFGRQDIEEIKENCGGGCGSMEIEVDIPVNGSTGIKDNSPTKHSKAMYHPQNMDINQNHIADSSNEEPVISVCPHCGEGLEAKTLGAGKPPTHFPGPAREYPEEFWKPETYYEDKKYVQEKIDFMKSSKEKPKVEMTYDMEVDVESDMRADVESLIHNIKLKADMLY